MCTADTSSQARQVGSVTRRVRLPLIGWVEVSSLPHVPDYLSSGRLITQHGSHWHIVLKLKSQFQMTVRAFI